jgi:hypothetical protein
MKRLVAVITLSVVGLGLLVTGVWFIFWPAALCVAGVGILFGAAVIDIPDRLPAGQAVNIVDETSEEPIATIARVRG